MAVAVHRIGVWVLDGNILRIDNMRSWELNARELLQLVHGADLQNVVTEPTPQSVGGVVICRLGKTMSSDPTEITDLGILDYCSVEGKRVALTGRKKGTEHEDGSHAELFVRSYMNNRRKLGSLAKMKSMYSMQNIYIACNINTCFLFSLSLLFQHRTRHWQRH